MRPVPGPVTPGAPPGLVTVHPLPGLPEVQEGDDLAGLVLTAVRQAGLALQDGDVLVVSSKVVSKALGLRVPDEDRQQVVLRHSRRVVAERATASGVTRIVEAQAGPVMVGAGVDGSNTGPDGGLLLLPADPDREADRVHRALAERVGSAGFGVVLSDTAGRPWRVGQTDLALGCSQVAGLDDLRGGVDADGRPLAVTTRAVADEIAAAADLVKGKQGAVAAALVRGLPAGTVSPGAAGARSLIRTGPGDWFALGSVEAVRAALGVAPGSGASEELGLPSAGPEDEGTRAERAVRLATADRPDRGCVPVQVQVEAPGRRFVVTGHGDLAHGRMVARLEVARHAEGLGSWEVEVRTAPGG